MSKQALKGVLQRAGLYPAARHWYRRLSPSARNERRLARQFYGQLIRPGDPVFDVGANVGQTIEAVLACGGRVVAVEPNPRCLPALRWQFGHDGRVTLVEKAVGAARGSATLNFDGTASTASLRPDWPFANRNSQAVEVTTLDDLIAQFGRPRLCKVDVEGFEEEVFNGLNQPIPIILFEMHRAELERARRILSRLATIGPIEGICLANAENTGNLLPHWAGLEEFSERLERTAPPCGNVLVKMRA